MAKMKVQNQDGTWEEVKIKIKGETENLTELTNRVEIVENLIKNGNVGDSGGTIVTPVETHKHENLDVLNKLSEQGELLLFNNKEIIPSNLNTRIDSLESSTSTINSELELIGTELELVGTEIIDLKQFVGNGKNLIATAITDKGVITSSDNDFSTMAENILSIKTIDEYEKTEDYGLLNFDFYVQEEEPIKKKGVWIKKNKKLVNKFRIEESLESIYAPKDDVQDVDLLYEIPKTYPLYDGKRIKLTYLGNYKCNVYLQNELTEEWEFFREVDFYKAKVTSGMTMDDVKYINGKIYISGFLTLSSGDKNQFLYKHDLDSNVTSVDYYFGNHNDGLEFLWVGNVLFIHSRNLTTPYFAKYDTDTNVYTVLNNKNVKSQSGAFIHHNGYIYYIGGNESSSTNSASSYMSNRFQRYDTETNTWTTLADLPTKIHRLQAYGMDDYIYVFFGNVLSSGSTTASQWGGKTNSILKYSITDNVWSTAMTFPNFYPNYFYITVEYYNNYFYIKSKRHSTSSSYSSVDIVEDKYFKVHLGEEINIQFKGEQNCIHIERDVNNIKNLECNLFDMKIGELNLELGKVVYSDNLQNITDCIVYEGNGTKWTRIM